MNQFVKMERQNMVRMLQPLNQNTCTWDHLQRWSQIFRSEGTEMDLSIWLRTQISGVFGIIESTLYFPEMINSFIYMTYK